nr:MAG TPA: hypothetical protein [Caudoviricetes sp.]
MKKQKKSSKPIAKQVLELLKLILEIITLILAIIKSLGK